MAYGVFLFSVTLLCVFHLCIAVLSLRKLKQDIDIVEARQTLENKLRKADTESVLEKLEHLEEMIENVTEVVEGTGQTDAVLSSKRDSGKISRDLEFVSEDVKSLKSNFLRLLQGFAVEKNRNANKRKLLDELNDRFSGERIKQEVTNSVKSIVYKEIAKLRQEIHDNLTEHFEETAKRKKKKTSDRFKSCLELLEKGSYSESGVYTIYPNGLGPAVRVFCDQETDGGGWTVFQRRKDGSVDFYRGWSDYKVGFGDLNGEFWLGNDFLSVLTSTGNHDLRIDLVAWKNDEKCHAVYSGFRIGPETTNYTLSLSAFTGGSCGDSLSYHKGMDFSTKDRDHDNDAVSHCAQRYTGAWWYDACLHSGLNGRYGTKPNAKGSGIYWFSWKRDYEFYSKFSEMKFK